MRTNPIVTTALIKPSVGASSAMSWSCSALLAGLLLALLLGAADAGFYLPGVAPKSYAMKDNVPLKVRRGLVDTMQSVG